MVTTLYLHTGIDTGIGTFLFELLYGISLEMCNCFLNILASFKTA